MKTVLIALLLIIITYSIGAVLYYAFLHIMCKVMEKKQKANDKAIDNALDNAVVGPALRKAETGANDYPYNSWAEYYEEEAITNVPTHKQ